MPIILIEPPPRRIRAVPIVQPRIQPIPMFRQVPFEQEPKRNNRFVVEFPEAFGIESFLIQNINKPSFTFMNNIPQWNNIEIEFIDVIGPSTTIGINNLIQFCKNQQPKWFQRKKKTLFELNIKALDPIGVEVECWTIQVEELLSANFGHFDYSDDGVQKCKILLKPFNCILQQ